MSALQILQEMESSPCQPCYAAGRRYHSRSAEHVVTAELVQQLGVVLVLFAPRRWPDFYRAPFCFACCFLIVFYRTAVTSNGSDVHLQMSWSILKYLEVSWCLVLWLVFKKHLVGRCWEMLGDVLQDWTPLSQQAEDGNKGQSQSVKHLWHVSTCFNMFQL